ncbi:MAG: prepilin-type N-terminal cleavage/methylation domain-containing protein [Deltaproteobacteria bacterium]|nr:prepilin-type N-terminal cleavage/methylation domain-containing protein [Deltaproteobacteria bacterium]
MSRQGFTLIELLMAVTMLAMMIGIMGGALSSACRTSETGEKKINALERKKVIFSLIESQIQSAFFSAAVEQGETKNRFAGVKDKVTFPSNYSLWRGTKGNCLVTYRIEAAGRQKCIFHIEEELIGTGVRQEKSLATHFDSIRFEYYYEEAAGEGRWVDEWPKDAPGMPQKLQIHFTRGESDRVLTARIMTQAMSAAAAVTAKPVVTR